MSLCCCCNLNLLIRIDNWTLHGKHNDVACISCFSQLWSLIWAWNLRAYEPNVAMCHLTCWKILLQNENQSQNQMISSWTAHTRDWSNTSGVAAFRVETFVHSSKFERFKWSRLMIFSWVSVKIGKTLRLVSSSSLLLSFCFNDCSKCELSTWKIMMMICEERRGEENIQVPPLAASRFGINLKILLLLLMLLLFSFLMMIVV